MRCAWLQLSGCSRSVTTTSSTCCRRSLPRSCERRPGPRPGPAPKRPSPSSISLPAACPGLVICRGDEWLEHPGTLGRGFTDTEIPVLDADNRELPAGEVGAIYMRTPTRPAPSYVGDDVTQMPRTDDGS